MRHRVIDVLYVIEINLQEFIWEEFVILSSKTSIWETCVGISEQVCRSQNFKICYLPKVSLWCYQFCNVCENDFGTKWKELSTDEQLQNGQSLETLHQPVRLLWRVLLYHCQGGDHQGGPEVHWSHGQCHLLWTW